jgi:hypothetical protein
MVLVLKSSFYFTSSICLLGVVAEGLLSLLSLIVPVCFELSTTVLVVCKLCHNRSLVIAPCNFFLKKHEPRHHQGMFGFFSKACS